jgi:3-dehydroquinate synthase
MKEIKVNLKQDSYSIYIGAGILDQASVRLGNVIPSHKVVIITNPLLQNLYGEALKKNLIDNEYEVEILSVPDGEEQKSIGTATALYEKLEEFHAERTTSIIALGGGVIGDLAGFVAATYLRGIPFIQAPTTLLAQVDSSVGGKVAIDHNKLKNRIGAFYQPKLVISDTNTLRTLPYRDIANGLAEIIKHGLIWDESLFKFIDENMDRIISIDLEVLEELIYRAVKVKAAVIERDEKDLNLRNILNYGHTIGHAIETLSDFQLKHGEAVAIGMELEGEIARRMGMLTDDELGLMNSVIKKAGLYATIPELKAEDIIDVMKHDKKVQNGRIRFVLLDSIGKAVIRDDVEMGLVEEILKENYE